MFGLRVIRSKFPKRENLDVVFKALKGYKGMKPEQLKQIAEWVGYEAAIKPRNVHGSVMDDVWLVYQEMWYKPKTSADESMELLKKLLDEGWVLDYSKKFNLYTFTQKRTYRVKVNESLEQAILNAAWECVKNDN